MAAAARRAMQQQGAQQQLLQLALATTRSAAVSADWMITDVASSSRIPGAVSSSSAAAFYNRQPLQGGRQQQQPSEVLCTLAPLKPWNYTSMRGYYMRNVSQLVAPANGKKAFLVDTLALVLILILPLVRATLLILLEILGQSNISTSLILRLWTLHNASVEEDLF